MQTSLPALPFTMLSNAELDPFGTYSASKMTERKYPRSDLRTLTPWVSFPDDICRAVQSAATAHPHLSTPFNIGGIEDMGYVGNEEDLRAYAVWALHMPVMKVLNRLGVNGWFKTPGRGNTAIIGDPDFSWIASAAQPHPKLMVRVPVTTCFLVVK